MRGAETWRSPSRATAKVQCTDFRTLIGGGGVIGSTEEPSLPVPALAPWVRGEAAVAGAGLELRAVFPIVRDATKQRQPAVQSARMKVDRYPQRRIQRNTVATRGDVGECLLLWRIGRRKPGVGVQR